MLHGHISVVQVSDATQAAGGSKGARRGNLLTDALRLQLLLDAGANVEGGAVRNGQESTADTPLQLASSAGEHKRSAEVRPTHAGSWSEWRANDATVKAAALRLWMVRSLWATFLCGIIPKLRIAADTHAFHSGAGGV